MNILNMIKEFNVKKANRRANSDSAQARSTTLLTDCTIFLQPFDELKEKRMFVLAALYASLTMKFVQSVSKVVERA